jgi:hypothetical protein
MRLLSIRFRLFYPFALVGARAQIFPPFSKGGMSWAWCLAGKPHSSIFPRRKATYEVIIALVVLPLVPVPCEELLV